MNHKAYICNTFLHVSEILMYLRYSQVQAVAQLAQLVFGWKQHLISLSRFLGPCISHSGLQPVEIRPTQVTNNNAIS